MNSDLFFRNYYFSLYDSLRLLHLKIFDRPAIIVSIVEKKWSSKIDNVLNEERRTLERCEEEIIVRRLRLNTLNELKLMIKEIETCGEKSFPRSLPGSKRLRGLSERDSGVSWLRT